MTQNEAVQRWLKGAEEAWDTAQKLLAVKKYDHSLFFIHLALEKIIKAVYIKRKDTFPPLIHDLAKLAEASGVVLSTQQKIQLAEATEFNISGRYEDDKLRLYKKATSDFTKDWHKAVKTLLAYFKKEL